MTRDTEVRPRRRPGLGTGLLTALFLVLLVGNRFEWWSYSSPWDLFLDLVIVWVAVAGLIVVGVVWTYRLYRYFKDSRRWPWPSVVAPLLILAAAVSFVLVEQPVNRDFDRARPQMEDLAESMLEQRTQQLDSTEINGVLLSPIYIADDNCVYFVDSKRTNTLSRHGWVYTAHCTPDPNNVGGFEGAAPSWLTFRRQGT